MSDIQRPCDLCHLPIEVAGFDLATQQGPKHFCCEGCQGIYRLLHEDDVLNDNADTDAA